MENADIRWKQRFQNFSKSFSLLADALEIKNPDITQRAGTIQFFEMTFELAWKTMKDFLVNEGFTDIQSPRRTLKEGFQFGLITDKEWLSMLRDRNITSHIYDEEKVLEIYELIVAKYFPLLSGLADDLKTRL